MARTLPLSLDGSPLYIAPISRFVPYRSIPPRTRNANRRFVSLRGGESGVGARGSSGSGLLGFRRADRGRRLCRAVSDGGAGGNYGFGGSGGSGGGDGDEAAGKGVSLAAWYLDALDKHPVFTKSVTSALLNMAGDLICQVLINQVPTLDLKRLSVITFLGFVLVGPTLHFWYLSLCKFVTLSGPSGTVLRLLLDQFFFSPIFIGVFFSSLVTLEGRPNEIVPKLQQEWLSAVKANWQLWIPFQFLNFQFVPQQLQVLAANVVALAWNVILSFLAHREIILNWSTVWNGRSDAIKQSRQRQVKQDREKRKVARSHTKRMLSRGN